MPDSPASAPLPGDVSSDALLRTLLAVSLTGVILFRPVYDAAGDVILDFTYAYLNPAAQQMLGLPEQPAESFLTLFPMADPVGIFSFYCEVFGSGEARRREFNYQHEGLDGYFHLAAQRQGPLLVASFTDTNDQPRTAVEDALRQSQAREQQYTRQLEAARAEAERQHGELARVFEQAPVAIAVYRGPTYTIELANPTVARLWGRTREQLLGKGLFEALPEVAGMGYEQLLDEVMATGVPHVAHAMEAQHERNGQRETVYWNFVYVPMYAAEGSINGAMVVATEVTEQVQARRRVEQLNQELEARVRQRTDELAALNEELLATNDELTTANTQLTRTNVDLDTFVYTASHDLKAPITNIEGLLSALRREVPAAVQDQPTTAKILSLMGGAVERFKLTLDQLTDISRLQHAQDQPAEAVQLTAVVEAVRLDLLSQITQAQARLTVEIPPDVYVQFPPRSMRSVAYNLLSNALKYHQPNQPPVVLLRATRLENTRCVVFTVQDQGLGLSQQQQGRLFGLFQRLHPHVEGTGVGLYTVKRLVENGGGTIRVESQPGQGATFIVILPAD